MRPQTIFLCVLFSTNAFQNDLFNHKLILEIQRRLLIFHRRD